MNRTSLSLLAMVSTRAMLAAAPAAAQEKRFDANVFRPSAGPRDLVMVLKSEVIGNVSPVVGLYSDVAFNPLNLVLNNDTNSRIKAVTAGLTLTPMAGIGFFNWVDLTLAVPLVAWQTGANLRDIGSEGSVSSNAVGDMRLAARLSVPYFNRKDEVKSGFGLAVGGNVNLPTGNPAAFTGDGQVTGGPVLIADYRFGFGLLVAANAGVWFRPRAEFINVKIGDMGSFGVAAEQYILQSKGISVIGEVYGYPSLTKFPDSPRQVPAEVLLALRWQSKHGISITFGGTFGAACGFGAPSLRLFSSITWQPEKSREQEEINRLQQRDEDDPDHDGLIGDADRCPHAAGPPENRGCPDSDSDGDGVPDRLDECPEIPQGPHGKNGCPRAYVKGNEIIVGEPIHFATDTDVILDDSRPILAEVAQVLIDHPEIREVEIEGHTDARASNAYHLRLSHIRAESVRKALHVEGVDASRVNARGVGHTRPVYDDSQCLGSDEGLSQGCRTMTSKNRRMVFRIVRRGWPPPRPITGAADGNASVLPTKAGVLPTGAGVLKNQGALPTKPVLPSSGVLPEAGSNPGLPQATKALPDQGVLPRQGTPKNKPEEPAPAPKEPASKKPPPKEVPKGPTPLDREK